MASQQSQALLNKAVQHASKLTGLLNGSLQSAEQVLLAGRSAATGGSCALGAASTSGRALTAISTAQFTNGHRALCNVSNARQIALLGSGAGPLGLGSLHGGSAAAAAGERGHLASLHASLPRGYASKVRD